MWSRFRAPAGPARTQNRTSPGDGAALLNSPLRTGWTASETARFRLFIPQPYAASYAYPLVVFLHDEAGSDADLGDWFPEVSGQNFLAAAVKAPFPHALGFPGQFSWRGRHLEIARQIVVETVETVARQWRLHHERIYLMGVGVGAELAVQLVLDGAGPFAGAIAIDCEQLPDPECPDCAEQQPVFCEKRFLIVQRQTPVSPDGPLPQSLESLGHAVHAISPLQGKRGGGVHAAINRWLMSAIHTTIW